MILLCASLAGLTQLGPNGEDDPDRDRDTTILEPKNPPRKLREYPPAALQNPESWNEVSGLMDRRRSPFRPSVGGMGLTDDEPQDEAWPDIRLRRVNQPTPGGVWIAQLLVDNRAYIARENGSFANNQYELVRIDKTRQCVEVLRRLDDEVREICQE